MLLLKSTVLGCRILLVVNGAWLSTLFSFFLFFPLLFFACVDLRLGFMSLAGGYCHIMVSQSVSQPEGSWDVAGAEADHLDANKVGHEVI